ncbi:hypothetical protein LQE85_19260 [Stenotrophomonas rhizophila]|uniref:hypothetical protein n=1 Tax=Stenotrophomonas rhizophila TaxID=216778 RepID=UPI00201D130D|nr:hypothetical protein [Stenotrophomonas rhizophila]UQY87584.1 hypothetical protein LQE85_19260 [Stenotrophomonas rhizophila]
MSERGLESLGMFIGKAVTVSHLEGQVSISTDDGWSLHIYNRVVFSGLHSADASPFSLRLEVTASALDGGGLTLTFDDGSALHVDLSDDGCAGPEAMQLNSPDGGIIVWN